jgi:hypothetical protein
MKDFNKDDSGQSKEQDGAAGGGSGHVDEIQAWKAQMKELERQKSGKVEPPVVEDSTKSPSTIEGLKAKVLLACVFFFC